MRSLKACPALPTAARTRSALSAQAVSGDPRDLQQCSPFVVSAAPPRGGGGGDHAGGARRGARQSLPPGPALPLALPPALTGLHHSATHLPQRLDSTRGAGVPGPGGGHPAGAPALAPAGAARRGRSRERPSPAGPFEVRVRPASRQPATALAGGGGGLGRPCSTSIRPEGPAALGGGLAGPGAGRGGLTGGNGGRRTGTRSSGSASAGRPPRPRSRGASGGVTRCGVLPSLSREREPSRFAVPAGPTDPPGPGP